jgi:hypothetical protein
LWILASLPNKTFGEQFDKMAVLIGGRMILALASGRRRGGGEASDGRHFEIPLNLTFGRAPPSKGLPSKA